MSFSDYIMRILLPKGFKIPTDMEPYEGSIGPQEDLDSFKSRITLAGAFDPIKCTTFLIMLKKAALKWFNSLPLRSINGFSDLSSQFLAYFTTRRFKPKLCLAYQEYSSTKESHSNITSSVSMRRHYQWKSWRLKLQYLPSATGSSLAPSMIHYPSSQQGLWTKSKLGPRSTYIWKRYRKPRQTQEKIMVL